jgi:hypothetical protein
MGQGSGASAGRCFAIELNSRNTLGEVLVRDGSKRVAIDGSIGTLRHLRFVEESVLELEGSEGTLRVNLSKRDLAKADGCFE